MTRGLQLVQVQGEEGIWVLMLILVRLRVKYMVVVEELGGEDSFTRVLQLVQVEHKVIWVLVLVLARLRVENMVVVEE